MADLYKMAPEAVMRLIQAGMTVLDLDNFQKKENPLVGMSTKGRIELAEAINEANLYLASVQEILGEMAQQKTSEEGEVSRRVSEDNEPLESSQVPEGLLF